MWKAIRATTEPLKPHTPTHATCIAAQEGLGFTHEDEPGAQKVLIDLMLSHISGLLLYFVGQ